MEKVKNRRMEVRMKWKYGMALLGFRILDFRIICVRSPLRSTTQARSQLYNLGGYTGP